MDHRVEQDRLILVQAHLLFSTFGCDSCDDTIQNMWLSIGSAVRMAQVGNEGVIGHSRVLMCAELGDASRSRQCQC